ncbi:MAG: hypothetical protein ACLQEQ_00405 [Nitrososphaerales archaeon]
MKALAVAMVVVALSLSGAWALLALSSPVKSLPLDPRSSSVCSLLGNVSPSAASPCEAAIAKYKADLVTMQLPFWTYQTYGDLAAGFLAAACLSLLAQVFVQRMSKGPKISVPRPFRDVALLGALAGLAMFAVCAFMDVVSTNPADIPNPLLFSKLLGADWTYYLNLYLLSGRSSLEAFGRTAFATFVVAVSGVFVYRLEEGVIIALAKTVTMFAAPVLIAFEAVLLLFTPVNMPIHVSALLDGTFLAGLLTNWFVLVVSSALLVLGLTHRRLGFSKGAGVRS